MRLSSVFLFISTTYASSLGYGRLSPMPGGLLSCSKALEHNPRTVAALVDSYAQVVGNYSEALAQSFLFEDFKDMSDSINVLAGIPLGSVTFPSKQAFMASQETQPKDSRSGYWYVRCYTQHSGRSVHADVWSREGGGRSSHPGVHLSPGR